VAEVPKVQESEDWDDAIARYSTAFESPVPATVFTNVAGPAPMLPAVSVTDV
jgi:hypothetical protein